MTPSRLLLVALAALALLAGLFVFLGNGEGSVAGGTAATPSGLVATPSSIARPSEPELESTSAPAASMDDEERETVQRTASRVAVGGRTLAVTVDVPAGSPPDRELSVVAMPAALLEDDSAADVLGGLRAGTVDESDVVRAEIAGGRAELSLPRGMIEPRLVVDGRFLFLREPVAVEADDVDARLAPELGAALAIQLTSPAGTDPVGELSLVGGDFSGRSRGWDRRELPIARDGDTVFRALDPALAWSVTPAAEGLHGFTETGLELEAGVERAFALELTLGVTVAGEVVDKRGEPLADVEVSVQGRGGWFGGRRSPETTTDAEGRFVLTALAPGEIQLEAELEGWLDTESEKLEGEDGERIDGLRLTLLRGSSIAGTITAPAAMAREVQGTLVIAERPTSGGGWGGWGGASRMERAGDARADADGNFEISGLEDGNYTVRAALHVESDDARWRAVAESVPTGTTDLLLELTGPIAFAGRVVDDLGEPVTAFEIVASDPGTGGPREELDVEDENGEFVFARVGPGEWEVTARAEGYERSEAVVVALPAASAEPLELRMTRRAVVAGRVVDSTGVPVAGARVRSGDGRGDNPWGGGWSPRTETDADGTFELEGLGAGGLVLSASADDWADSEELTLELAPGERRENVELALRMGGRIVGIVATPEGDPQAGRNVTWGAGAGPWGSRGDTTTDAAGRFEFEHVTPGEWSVAAGPSRAEMSRNMRGGGQTAFVEAMSDLDVETVTVEDGEVTEVFLGGEPKRPVKIFGVISRNGQPFPEAEVYAVSEDSAVFEGMKAAVSAADGSYELTVDRPGAYAISVRADTIGAEVMVDVPRSDEIRVDLAIPLGRIEGTVRGPGGERAEGIRLSIQREDGLGRMRWNGNSATTDENGDYAFEDLEAGSYSVRANTASWGRGAAYDLWGSGTISGVSVGKDVTTSNVDFELETAGSVEGIVRDSEGSPLAGMTVFFRDAAGQLVSTVSGTRTDAAGRFEESRLAPGRYTLSARGDGLAANEAASVEVVSSETAEVELEVETGTMLLVSLENEEGEAQRSRVEVFDGDGREVGGLTTVDSLQSAFSEGASTRERRVGPLPPGRYTVRASLQDGTSEERRVTLRERGGEKKVTLRL